ncbi:MAG: cbb3-type cytochrome oxidase assembly protein CcoS [Bdellovibrionales bacterium]|nr:cbb3-type cytochrome oxidase assembly protein CcoS [Bdellovibrionales bacterium]
MNILFLLIPIALVIVILMIGGFLWAVQSEQFEDLETPSYRILNEEKPKLNAEEKRVLVEEEV